MSLSQASSQFITQGSPCSTCSFIEDRRHSLASISSLSSLSDISPLPSPEAKPALGGIGIPLNALGLSEDYPLSENAPEVEPEGQEQKLDLVYPYAPSSVSLSVFEEASNDDISPSSTSSNPNARNLPLPQLSIHSSFYTSDPSSECVDEDSPIDPLEKGMRSLPTELVSQIFEDTLSLPLKSLRLSLLLTSKTTYRRVIPTLYRDVVLTKNNVERYFYGLGVSGEESSASPIPGHQQPSEWPVSGPGLAPLHTMGLSYDPSPTKATPFVRKFTLCNLVESLTISDLPSFLYLLRAASRTYVNGMDTWTHRVLFDQIDKITIGEEVFLELDNNLLGMRGLLGEIWNVIKGDAVHLHFPAHKKLKRETYMTAVNAFGAPSSLGQRDRLLGELVIRTPTLDGVGLDQTAASLVRIYLEPMISSNTTSAAARCEECEAALAAEAAASAGGEREGDHADDDGNGEVTEDQGVQVKEFIRREFWPSIPAPAPAPAQSPVPASTGAALTHSP
ncbi:hypothetical protein IAT40_004272 [Kwoniella sp. CBS 6097]